MEDFLKFKDFMYDCFKCKYYRHLPLENEDLPICCSFINHFNYFNAKEKCGHYNEIPNDKENSRILIHRQIDYHTYRISELHEKLEKLS